MMVGRSVELTVQKDAAGACTRTRLVVAERSPCIDPSRAPVIVDDVSFAVRGGEVLAIAGVQGNGQTELTEALARTRATAGPRLDHASTVKELAGRRRCGARPRRQGSASCRRTGPRTAW